MADEYVVEIRTPDLTWHDVTDRVDLEGLGGYSYGIEDSLLQFRTGDITALLDDGDGGASALFAGADPAAAYLMRIERNGTKVFEGVIALPGVVRSSLNEASLEVTAFGYMALLDQISAESVKRTITPGDASTTVGSDLMGFPPTIPPELTQDDKIRLASDVQSEEYEIKDTVTGLSNVRLKSNASIAFTSVKAEYLTPYYRRKTIPFLVQKLFEAAGITNPTIDLSGSDFDLAVAAPLNTDALPAGSVAISLNAVAGKVRARLTNANRDEYEAPNPTDGPFTVVGTKVGAGTGNPVSAITDWQVYEATEPTLAKHVAGNEFSNAFANEHRLYGGVDYDEPLGQPAQYGLRCQTTTNPNFWIMKRTWNAAFKIWGSDAMTLIELQTAFAGTSLLVGSGTDYDPIRDLVYFSYTVPGGTDKLGTFVGQTGVITTLRTGTGAGGFLRYNRLTDQMLHIAGNVVTAYRNGATLWTRTLTPLTGTASIKWRTLRYLVTAKRWVAIVQDQDRTKLLSATEFFDTVSYVDVAASASSDFQIPNDLITDASNHLGYYDRDTVVGRIDGQYVVVASRYAGVVVYADFSSRTIAGALTDLAKLVNCVAFVDENFNGFFISRNSLATTPQVKALDDLIITQEEDAIWEKWFGRVSVTVGAVTVTVGDASQVASEAEIEAEFTPNLSAAYALASAYQKFYSRPRRRRRVTVDDDETIYRPYQRVTIGPEEWAVYEIDHAFQDREVALSLVEAI